MKKNFLSQIKKNVRKFNTTAINLQTLNSTYLNTLNIIHAISLKCVAFTLKCLFNCKYIKSITLNE